MQTPHTHAGASTSCLFGLPILLQFKPLFPFHASYPLSPLSPLPLHILTYFPSPTFFLPCSSQNQQKILLILPCLHPMSQTPSHPQKNTNPDNFRYHHPLSHSHPPPFSVTLLGSGSSGNAALLHYNSTSILIDAGISLRQLQLRLSSLNLTLNSLHAILLTHEHSDHTAALPQLIKKFNIPLYANRPTAEAICWQYKLENPVWNYFHTSKPFHIGPFHVLPFSVSHDAADPVGFLISTPSSSLAILTDLGKVTNNVLYNIQNVNCLIIEANYDPTLLEKDSKRPWKTKQRISSNFGHLSNTQTAQAIASAASPSLKHIILCHLSADCNSPLLALSTVQNALHLSNHSHIPILCAKRDDVSPTIQF
ncbi:MAG: MBL fold metallo-hydrolase [Chthoniobacterales bacterium]|nr:MBL fold metallo-hydrolase [Chthoniobacterales bacterium]